jgi:hypothetical protein
MHLILLLGMKKKSRIHLDLSEFNILVVQVGLMEAFAIIVVAEIGDKSFFVAMILSMKYDKRAIFLGCMCALIIQAVISAAFGAFISQIDHDLLEWGAGIIYCEPRPAVSLTQYSCIQAGKPCSRCYPKQKSCLSVQMFLAMIIYTSVVS